MNTCVIDTSVTVAWYIEEAFSPSAREWQERLLAGKVRLLVPSLHYWEFANVLRTLVIRRDLSEELASEILDLHLDAPLEVAEPDRRLTLAAAFRYNATVYDAVFIALADAMEVPLVTAERTTTPWVVRLGKRVEPVR
jgi:predicted nucleic acid-binding protein